ncbi:MULTISPECIES: spore coat U domain-containing protein [Burkholderia]|jgi:spore coat protein U-like protein|uniref:Lipoprotein n=1 Tax=Burkholderia lata (strain ATCC 17760 / DSM 23089 / LMG 22485 / NCIMB 9086 / R18194 / 383) TaxID=482957 RepID=A0A6P2NJM6_BURL3|nr:spore coat U domain-containing protein [Burkholderia sp. Se-20378]VWB38181.1 lipoprotein [Burkholderia lata]VWB94861.1 lipoprotein [Burkholderia lata]
MADERFDAARGWLRMLSCLLLVVALGAPWASARADSCSVTPPAPSFGSVSPIRLLAVTTTSTMTVNCTWDVLSLNTGVLVCVNLGGTSPRYLSNGTNQMQYDLYQDSGYSQAWGSVSAGTTPISVTLQKPLLGTSASANITVYGRVTANQPTVPTVNNSSTVYTQSFSGNQATYSQSFSLLSILPTLTCAAQPVAGTVSFSATATVANDCIITATGVAFPATGVLTSPLAAAGSINARCTNGDAFQIALNGGSSGNVAARAMSRTGGGGSVGYQLYADGGYTTPWGDGTGGTSMATGSGSGFSQTIPVYGRVPAQTTPAPGNYSDTITATISF